MKIALSATHMHMGSTEGYILIHTSANPDSKILREWITQLVCNFRMLHQRYSKTINAFNMLLTHSLPCPNQLFRYQYDMSYFIHRYPLYTNEFILNLDKDKHKHYYNTIFGLNIEILDIKLLDPSTRELTKENNIYQIDVELGDFYMPDGKLLYNVLDLI